MAKTIDIELQKQLDKPQTWFCKYFPARIRNVGEREIADRQLVFDFKDGRAYEDFLLCKPLMQSLIFPYYPA